MKPDNNVRDYPGNFLQREILSGKKNRIASITIVALICLVLSVLFISFNIRLISGVLVITGASLFLLATRKTDSLIREIGELHSEESATNEKKDAVITDFSHRIREPLNNLMLAGDLLIDSDLKKKQKELLETFIASTNNMVTIVNELTMDPVVSMSQIRGRKIQYNIISTIQNTVELYRLREKTHLDIIFNKKDHEEFGCVGDPIILKQIILDVFNSIERQQNKRTIRVNINVRKEADKGITKIFGLRIQTDNNIPPVNDATGSGQLALKLITLSNGTFSQESGENSSVLSISMPFTFSAGFRIAGEPESDAAYDRAKTHSALKECNVLLVEDNPVNLKITLLMLSPFVRNIDTAVNGKEAIDKIKESNYDLILLDIQMPVMDGIATVKEIREMEKGGKIRVPIIAITAEAMIGDKEMCISAGMDDYLSKPFLPSELIEKINALLS